MNSKVRGTDMTMALVNGRIVLPDRVVTDRALVIESGRIADLADPGDLGSDVTHIDVDGSWITPGLIDIHTHGALRHTFNEPDPAAWASHYATRTCAAGPPRCSPPSRQRLTWQRA